MLGSERRGGSPVGAVLVARAKSQTRASWRPKQRSGGAVSPEGPCSSRLWWRHRGRHEGAGRRRWLVYSSPAGASAGLVTRRRGGSPLCSTCWGTSLLEVDKESPPGRPSAHGGPSSSWPVTTAIAAPTDLAVHRERPAESDRSDQDSDERAHCPIFTSRRLARRVYLMANPRAGVPDSRCYAQCDRNADHVAPR